MMVKGQSWECGIAKGYGSTDWMTFVELADRVLPLLVLRHGRSGRSDVLPARIRTSIRIRVYVLFSF